MKTVVEKPTTLCLPFLGSRPNNEIFEYLLLKINERSALISIPNWVVNRTLLQDAETISLHLNHYLKDSYSVSGSVSGVVKRMDDGKGGIENLYRIEFSDPLTPVTQVVEEMPLDGQSELIRLIKDSYFLKNGVFVYLKHLIPYFSRILKFSEEEYKDLKSVLLDDVHERVRTHMQGLEKLNQELEEKKQEGQDCLLNLNLDQLRKMIQSEIDLSLFELALAESMPKSGQQIGQFLAEQTYTQKSFYLYLHSIKIVEDRLYDNYNYIVFLYAQSLSASPVEMYVSNPG